LSVLQGRQVAHIKVTMNFLKASKFMSEMTSFAVHANLFPVECATILRLVLIIWLFGLLHEVKMMFLAEFIWSMSILALISEPTEVSLSPVLAQFPLVH